MRPWRIWVRDMLKRYMKPVDAPDDMGGLKNLPGYEVSGGLNCGHKWYALPVEITGLVTDAPGLNVALGYSKDISDYKFCTRCDRMDRRYMILLADDAREWWGELNVGSKEYNAVIRIVKEGRGE